MFSQRFNLVVVTAFLSVISGATAAQAQTVSDSDFVSVSSATVGLYQSVAFSVSVSVNFKTPPGAITLPLSYAGHPKLHVDTSGGANGITYDSIGNLPLWDSRTVLIDSANRTILLGLLDFHLNELKPLVGPLLTIHFVLDSADVPGTVVIDTIFLPPANHLSIVDEWANEYWIQFTPGVITIETNEPAISLNPTNFAFWAREDSANPAPKTLSITNIGTGTLHWSASANQPWISVAPSFGTGNGSPSVSVSIEGLLPGVYTGNVQVSDSLASNSPQYATVSLEITRKPTPADSNYVSISTARAPLNSPSKFTIDVAIGTTQPIIGAVIPITYAGSPFVRLDRTAGDSTNRGISFLDLGDDPAWTLRTVAVDTVNKRLALGVICFGEPFDPAEGRIASLHFVADSTALPDTVVVDTTFYPPANHVQFADEWASPIVPSVSPGAIILDELPDSICISPNPVLVHAVQYGPLPDCAYTFVKNCGAFEMGDVTAVYDDCGFADLYNTDFSDSLRIAVCPITTDLEPGLHVCTLTVMADWAINPREPVIVHYQIDSAPEPPPEFSFRCDVVARDLSSDLEDFASFGMSLFATDGYDLGIDLFKAPAPPPDYVRVYFDHPEWGEFQDEFTSDIRGALAEGCKEWPLVVECSEAGTLELQINCAELPDGLRVRLLDEHGFTIHPNFINIPYSYPAAAGQQRFTIRVCSNNVFIVDYAAGWNLISSPVEPADPSLLDVFGPDADLWQFYGWDGAYFPLTEFHGCGMGYWLLLPEARSIMYKGAFCQPASGPVCIPTRRGWNLIGLPFEEPIDGATVEFDSAGVILSFDEAFLRGWFVPIRWGWSDGRYVLDNTIYPGRGYWMPILIDGINLCMNPTRHVRSVPMVSAADAMTIQVVGSSDHVRIGVRTDATVGFDARYDLPLPPNGPGSSGPSIQIESALNPLFDAYYQDVRPLDSRIEWHMYAPAGTLHFTDVATLKNAGYKLTMLNLSDSSAISIDVDGDVAFAGGHFALMAQRVPTDVDPQRPLTFYLGANYPNPFNPTTVIRFGLAASGHATLTIYNLLGQKVRVLADQDYLPGEYELPWDGTDDRGQLVSSGVYFYRLKTADFDNTRKMLLMK